MIQPDAEYHHDWQKGDIVIWDNRCSYHKAAGDYPPEEDRIHWRVSINDYGVEAAARRSWKRRRSRPAMTDRRVSPVRRRAAAPTSAASTSASRSPPRTATRSAPPGSTIWCCAFATQPMTDAQHMAFTRQFGELEFNPAALIEKQYGVETQTDGRRAEIPPEISVISNIIEDGKAIGGLGDGEAFWHTDSSFVDVPPAASLLRSLEVPPPSAGGAT